MSSIWKDFRSNPRVLWCFTCLCCVSSFLCIFKPLGCQPRMTLWVVCFLLLVFFALDCHLELTFQYDRICQLKALPRRVQNVFWQELDSNPCTHSCTRILDWGMSWVWRLRPLGHPVWFTSTYFLLICVFSIEWHFQFRDVICWMVCVISLERFEFKPARRVVFYMSPPGILFFVHFWTARLSGYQPPNDVASRLFSFALGCHLELTFQYDRICQLKALPHRVQNVFWQEWDSNPRTHSCTRILDWGISWVWRLRLLAHPAWLTSTFFCMMCAFSIG